MGNNTVACFKILHKKSGTTIGCADNTLAKRAITVIDNKYSGIKAVFFLRLLYS